MGNTRDVNYASKITKTWSDDLCKEVGTASTSIIDPVATLKLTNRERHDNQLLGGMAASLNEVG